MAGTMKSALSQISGALAAASETVKNETGLPQSFGEMPPNVEGVAYLKEMKFDLHKDGDNKGKPFFYAAAIAITPDFVIDDAGNQRKVKGRRTNQNVYLYDTPTKASKTLQDNLNKLYALFRMFGVDTSQFTEEGLDEQLELTIQAIVQSQPCIRFSTRQGQPTMEFPNPRTFHQWEEVCEPPEGFEHPGDGVEESAQVSTQTPPPPKPAATKPPAPAKAPAAAATAPKPAAPKPSYPPKPAPVSPVQAKPAPVTAKPPAAAPKAPMGPKPGAPKPAPSPAAKAPLAPKPGPKPAAPKPAPAPEPVPSDEYQVGDEIPFDELVAAADDATNSEQESAAARLTEIANKHGITDDQIGACGSWSEIAELIKSVVSPEDGAAPAEDAPADSAGDEWHPAVGDVFLFKGTDPKTKKPMTKAIEVEISAVQPDERTCWVLSLEDRNKTWKGVKYDQLENMA